MTDIPTYELVEKALPILRGQAAQVDTDASFPADQIAALADQGLLGLLLSPEVGGLGGGPTDLVEVMSKVAGACGSTAMVYLMHLSASAVTAAAPPTDAGTELLSSFASGSKLGTSRSARGAPAATSGRRCRGPARSSSGSVALGADKSWVTSASRADVYITSTLAPGAEGMTQSNLYAVQRSAPGVQVARRSTVSDSAATIPRRCAWMSRSTTEPGSERRRAASA